MSETEPRALTEIDVQSWSRRAHFEHFIDYRDPWFHLTAEVDVTALKESTSSLGLGVLWSAGVAANAVPELALRLRSDGEGEDVRVVQHERLDVGCTVLRDNDTFTFAYLGWCADQSAFMRDARAAVDRAKTNTGLIDDSHRDDLVYTSILPWVRFTSVGHSHRLDGVDAVPRIAFGKVTEQDGRWVMPANIEAHHALVDGLHLARWFDALQAALNQF